MDRDVLPKKFPVTEGDPSRPINPNNVLVILPNLDYSPGSVPLEWMWSCLILNADMVSNSKGKESFGVLSPTFCISHVAGAKCFFTSF